MPAWALVAAASIAAAAGVGAVTLASDVLALVGGIASAVTALLALDGRLARDRATSAEAAEGIGSLEALLAAEPAPAPEADRDVPTDDGDDPIRALFESGPPAGGSGLLDEHFLPTTLRGRLAGARRSLRPLAVVCLEVLETEGAATTVPVADEEVARVLRRTLREADLAGRAGPGTYVCILEDTGEDGAVWTAERLRRNLCDGGGRVRRFRAGVAAYPTHGLEGEELEAKARAALVAARDWATDRIEVAPGA